MKQAELKAEIDSIAERSYDQLTGEWKDWLDIARKYETKIPAPDRPDFRHDCMLELQKARQRDRKPLPKLRAYRIASLMVARYWREVNKPSTRVCIYSGIAKSLHCNDCDRKPIKGQVCPWIARRPIQSLESEVTDSEGHTVTLLDTVASGDIHDMPEAWTEISTWLLGCPLRLIEIAEKRRDGEALSAKDRQYLKRYLDQSQKSLF